MKKSVLSFLLFLLRPSFPPLLLLFVKGSASTPLCLPPISHKPQQNLLKSNASCKPQTCFLSCSPRPPKDEKVGGWGIGGGVKGGGHILSMSNCLVNNHCQQECTKDQKSAIVIFGQWQGALIRPG